MAGIARFDCYEVDLEAPRISRRGTTLRVRDQSLTILLALLEHPGKVVTREDLHRRLWPEGVFVDFDNVLNTAVVRLREALGDSPDHPRFIETLPKHGYRFIAPVQLTERPADGTRRRPRLLVLPFANNSSDPAQDYFASAMTDEIITAVATFAPNALAALARTTTFHYKGTRKSIAAIAGELDLDYVVEGGAHRDEKTATLNVQLIRAGDETHLWAGRFDAALNDLLGTQLAIAGAVGAAIGIGPAAGAGPRSAARKPTENLEAHTQYRLGRHHLLSQTPENFAAAKHCFEQAIAHDPQFALAYDARADLWWYYDFMGFAPPKTIAGMGMDYTLRALDIDSSFAETHALLGHYRWLFEYDWRTLERHLDRARELNPALPLVRLRYAMGPLLVEGRFEEAIAELQAALESDPLSILIRAWLAIMLYLDRGFERGLEEAHRIVELERANYVGYWLAGAYARECGLFEESIAAHRKSIDLSGGSMLMLGWYGLALGQAGRIAEARDVLGQLAAAAESQRYVPPSCFA